MIEVHDLSANANQQVPAGEIGGSISVPGGGPLSSIDAANELIALPWSGLVQEYLTRTNENLAKLNGYKFINTSGSVKQMGTSWEFSLGEENLTAHMNLSSPPGFSEAVPDRFSLRAPLEGSWSFGVSGQIKAHAKASISGPLGERNLVSGTITMPFMLGMSEVWLSAGVELSLNDPARPRLASASLHAHARINGNVLFPGFPIDFDLSRAPDGILTGRVPHSYNIEIPNLGVGVSFSGDLIIRIFPYSLPISYQGGPQIINFSDTLLVALVGMDGAMSVRFPDPVGRVVISTFSYGLPILIPVPTDLADHIALVQGDVPLQWPPAGTPINPDGLVPPPPSSIDFATTMHTLEEGIAAHVPYGAILSIDYPPRRQDTPPTTGGKPSYPLYTYGVDADSTIWTGHYLAAEAFRFAVTGSSEAMARIQTLIGGLQKDFNVTTDAVITDSGYRSVPATYNGIFARSALPHNDPHGWTRTLDDRMSTGDCLYIKPTGGWILIRQSHPPTIFPTLEYALQAAKTIPIFLRTIVPVETADQPIWYGTGCGDNFNDTDTPISRDQYSGIFMGLAFAYALVPDPEVRLSAQILIERALDYLINPQHPWNVPLPPDGRVTTSFVGNFSAQLGLLRIGATINPAKYGSIYQRYASASALAWIPAWFSTIDPLSKYFKFNLGHAFLGPTLFFELDPDLRQNYLRAYNILRASTLTHRNAYFNLADILVGAASSTTPSTASNSLLSLGDEIRSDLNDWIARLNLVKGSNGMPRNVTSHAAATYLSQQWPSHIQLYSDSMGKKSFQVDFALALYNRTGHGMDFVWQRSPFDSGIDSPGSDRMAPEPGGIFNRYACGTIPPTGDQINACSSQVLQEGPGVDFLLAYWLGVYLNVIPGP